MNSVSDHTQGTLLLPNCTKFSIHDSSALLYIDSIPSKPSRILQKKKLHLRKTREAVTSVRSTDEVVLIPFSWKGHQFSWWIHISGKMVDKEDMCHVQAKVP